VDACINLRWPAAGETSGIGIRLMGLGKPVLATDGEENARYPQAACLRISPGVDEEDSLRRHMLLVTVRRDCAREIGERARGHIASYHQPARVAELYWQVLCGGIGD
jgi:hypothetical protein